MQSQTRTLASHADLRYFLTFCRARLHPEDVGLRNTHRRRVPGLRREEVAELVGVSARWYASFEAGKKDRRFSAIFIHRVADALRLNVTDRVWLFRLALPEAAAVAEHFEIALSQAESAAFEAQVTAGRALASSIYRHLAAQETLREIQAAAGEAIATAIYSQVATAETLSSAQAAAGRTLAAATYRRLVQRLGETEALL